jgi:hypothetical protein
LVDRYPGLPARLAGLLIEKWDPATPRLRSTCCSRRCPRAGSTIWRQRDVEPGTGGHFRFHSCISCVGAGLRALRGPC